MTYRGTQITYLLDGEFFTGQFMYHVPILGDKIELKGDEYLVISRVWPDYAPLGDETEKVTLEIIKVCEHGADEKTCCVCRDPEHWQVGPHGSQYWRLF